MVIMSNSILENAQKALQSFLDINGTFAEVSIMERAASYPLLQIKPAKGGLSPINKCLQDHDCADDLFPIITLRSILHIEGKAIFLNAGPDVVAKLATKLSEPSAPVIA